jgi:beta-lactamase regulating signal transducer with metallopeptidase domain
VAAAILDHLWQSTLFAAGIGLLAAMVRDGAARMRFWLWFAASMKFLVPFAALAAAGSHLLRPLAAAPSLAALSAMQPAAEPFAAAAPVLPATAHAGLSLLLVALWAGGSAIVLGVWLMRWTGLRRSLRGAADLPVAAPVPVKSSAALLEPGLVGIWRPVILLPEGVFERISPAEMAALLAHEQCHLTRRDNLMAALHMMVAALFWFHPLVWWIGTRLVEHRERACDEAVLAAGHDPKVYAGGILKICRFHLQSPLACASALAGADLKTRVAAIMANHPVAPLGGARKSGLATAAAAAVLLPLIAGVAGPHLPARLQTMAAAVATHPVIVASSGHGERDAWPVVETAPVLRAHRHAARRHVIQTAEAEQPAGTDQSPAMPQDNTPSTALQAIDPGAVLQTAAWDGGTAATQKDRGIAAATSADDAGAVICRRPQTLPGSRLPGPKVCLTNRAWAVLKARGLDIAPDGSTIVDPAGRPMVVAGRTIRAFSASCPSLGGPGDLLASIAISCF